MPYKDKAMKSRRQKERRKGEAPTKVKPLSEAPKVYLGTRDPVPMSEVAELLEAF